MTRSLRLLLPGDPLTATGGYLYDRNIAAALRALGWQVDVISLDSSFPFPTEDALDRTRAQLAAIPDGALTLIDGLALGAMPDEALAESARLTLIALVHHPLAAETGLSPEQARRLRDSEARALRAVRAVITTSATTAAALRAYYAVPAAQLHPIEPGVDRPPSPSAAAASPPSGLPLQMLCVATLTPRKGHALLLRALAAVQGRSWHLHCIGSLTRDPGEARRLRALCAELGLSAQVSFHGEVGEAELQDAMRRADLFVLSAWYEGYGMAVAEALAFGLPVVTTDVGAAAELLGCDAPQRAAQQCAGLLVPPGDLAGLTQALDRAINDDALRGELAAGARQRAKTLPTWPQAARRLASVLEQVAAP